MRAKRPKKSKKPSRPIEYVLSADHEQRKLSLKKVKASATPNRRTRNAQAVRPASSSRRRMEGPPAKPDVPAEAAGSVKPVVEILPPDRARSTDSWAFAFTVVGAVAIAVMLTARPGSTPRTSNSSEAPRKTVPVTTAKPTAPEPRTVMNTKPVSAVTAPRVPPPTSERRLPVAAKSTPDAEAAKPAAAPVIATTAASEPTVTITGCLENHSGGFRLKDTSGADVPTERGWRTGFLRKRSAAIELVDPADRFKLSGYVGQRVAATGILSDRELSPRSVRRVAASCK